MKERSIFLNLSPLDHRYYLANKDLFEALGTFFSEEAAVRYGVKVEGALLETHARLQGHTWNGTELEESVSPEDVYQEEEKTKHNVRALVNVIKKHVPPHLSHLVHLGATSVDILDTAHAMRLRDGMLQVVLPLLIDLQEHLLALTYKERQTPQVGRTHGQHAVPITVGFWLAEYVARIGKSIRLCYQHTLELRGKLSGAVGAYNAMSLLYADPKAVEKEFLERLGLKPSDYAKQIVEPEYLLRLLLELNTAFGIIANLADDIRHLQRSEIGEAREGFGATQVGSSTMPQKRNPWNCEHVKSLWKSYSPRVITFYMDQISEHQRDLTNSASNRFIAEYIAGFCAATARMVSILQGLGFDRQALKKNLYDKGDMVLAEAAYVLLSLSGDPQAHETIRQATLECEKQGNEIQCNAPKAYAGPDDAAGSDAGSCDGSADKAWNLGKTGSADKAWNLGKTGSAGINMSDKDKIDKAGSLKEYLKKDPKLWDKLNNRLLRTVQLDADTFFSDPKYYTGKAAEVSLAVYTKFSADLTQLKSLLSELC